MAPHLPQAAANGCFETVILVPPTPGSGRELPDAVNSRSRPEGDNDYCRFSSEPSLRNPLIQFDT
jgi:hypothetical protein